MDGKIDVNITFDENNQIRVLSSEKFRETEGLKSECIDFLKSKWFNINCVEILQFNDNVQTLNEILE